MCWLIESNSSLFLQMLCYDCKRHGSFFFFSFVYILFLFLGGGGGGGGGGAENGGGLRWVVIDCRVLAKLKTNSAAPAGVYRHNL